MSDKMQEGIILGGLGLSVIMASVILFMAAFVPPNDVPMEYIGGIVILMIVAIYTLAYSQGLLTNYYEHSESGEIY